ncbi:MAG TPA: FAD:protein FMN transferase [Ktedonobacteraceae bacterium]|nr:FAD:protein FMN transferase [Ktedonobacteraceae bacterium]
MEPAVPHRERPVELAAAVALRHQPSVVPVSHNFMNMNYTNYTDYTTPPGMGSEEFRAMGTTISLLLPESQTTQGLQIVQTLFAEWEQTLSRFLPESELSRLNAQAGVSVVVSDLLYKVLTTALDAAQATQGLYDPAMLDQLVRLGYDRTFDDLPLVCYTPLFPGEPGGGWRGIRVDADRQRVTLPVGVKLDFGGIAKGMAVDAALEELLQNGINTALVNAGGDLAVLGLPPDAEHWPIAVPGKEQHWTIPILRGAVATSGIAHRQWWQGNKLQHHLIDPRTGQSAQSDLWSVTVVTDRCEQAEVAAKVAFILGSRKGAEFLRRYNIGGLLVHEDGSWETVEPWSRQLMEGTNK